MIRPPARVLATALAAFALLGAGCKTETPAGPQGPLPVRDIGARTDVEPAKEAPDEAARDMARLAIEMTAALGPDLQAFAPVAAACRAARTKFPTKTYRLAQVAGWSFLGGFWSQAEPDGSRLLRAALEGANNRPPAFDVTVEANYGPDMHPGFPAGIARFRYEIEHQLAGGGRMAVSFVAPFAEAGRAVDAVGTGSVAALGAAGAVGIEALNARLTADGAVERGDLVLRDQSAGQTMQLTAVYGPGGLQAGAKVIRSAQLVGEVVQADGRWQIKNEAGAFPLQ